MPDTHPEQQPLHDEAAGIVRNIGIPPMPAILGELAQECGKDAPDFLRIEKLISRDVALSATMLKTVNSPLFGLSHKAGSIKQAIAVLGLRRLFELTRALVLRQAFPSQSRVSMERFWDASAQMALATSHIARQLPGIDVDEAHTYGLFQDCGIPILMLRFPDYKETLALANAATDHRFTDIEEERYSVHHATVGYLLAKSWCLPSLLCQAIRCHHDESIFNPQSGYPAPALQLIAAALIAERIIHLRSGKAKTAEWEKLGATVLAHIGLSEEEFNELQTDLGQMLDMH